MVSLVARVVDGMVSHLGTLASTPPCLLLLLMSNREEEEAQAKAAAAAGEAEAPADWGTSAPVVGGIDPTLVAAEGGMYKLVLLESHPNCSITRPRLVC